jgi:hypothetical protein
VPEQRAAGVTSKYVLQYIFGAAATACIVPLIDAAGPGGAFSISRLPSHTVRDNVANVAIVGGLNLLGGGLVLYVARYAPDTGAWA